MRGGFQWCQSEGLAIPGGKREDVVLGITAKQFPLRQETHKPHPVSQSQPVNQVGIAPGFMAGSVKVQRHVVHPFVSQVGHRLDQAVDPLGGIEPAPRDNAENPVGHVAPVEGRRIAGHPVRDDLHGAAQFDPVPLHLLNHARADRDEPATRSQAKLTDQLGHDLIDVLAEHGRNIVAEMPNPRHAELLQSGDEAVAAEPNDIVNVDNIWLELGDLLGHDMDVERVDEAGVGEKEPQRQVPHPSIEILVPDVGEAENPFDVLRCRHGLARSGGKHQHLVTSLAKGVDGLGTRDLVSSKHVGGIEVRQNNDSHAASSRRSKGSSGSSSTLRRVSLLFGRWSGESPWERSGRNPDGSPLTIGSTRARELGPGATPASNLRAGCFSHPTRRSPSNENGVKSATIHGGIESFLRRKEGKLSRGILPRNVEPVSTHSEPQATPKREPKDATSLDDPTSETGIS